MIITVMITLILAAPVVVLVVLAVQGFHRAAASRAELRRTARHTAVPLSLGVGRLALAGTAVVTLVLGDVAWIVYSLHWPQIPLLTNIALGAVAVSVLLLLREREFRPDAY